MARPPLRGDDFLAGDFLARDFLAGDFFLRVLAIGGRNLSLNRDTDFSLEISDESILGIRSRQRIEVMDEPE
ncbi:MAG: hypothetical protein ABGW78_09950 [Pirellulales bacterium]